jgi:archaellum component FlaC
MDPNVDDLQSKFNRLSTQHKGLSDDMTLAKSELSARKNELKRLMDQVRDSGYDPNNLAAEIRREIEVLQLKLDNFESEITDAQKIIAPIIKEIKNA